MRKVLSVTKTAESRAVRVKSPSFRDLHRRKRFFLFMMGRRGSVAPDKAQTFLEARVSETRGSRSVHPVRGRGVRRTSI